MLYCDEGSAAKVYLPYFGRSCARRSTVVLLPLAQKPSPSRILCALLYTGMHHLGASSCLWLQGYALEHDLPPRKHQQDHCQCPGVREGLATGQRRHIMLWIRRLSSSAVVNFVIPLLGQAPTSCASASCSYISCCRTHNNTVVLMLST